MVYPLKPLSELSNCFFSFEAGGNVDYDSFLESIYNMGFERQGMVEEPGDFSVRGGIIDIYPYTFENPVRLELDGDSSQRSVESLESVIFISPVSDISVNEGKIDKNSGINFLDFIDNETRILKVEPYLYKNKIEEHIKEIIDNLSDDYRELFLNPDVERNFFSPDEITDKLNSIYRFFI